MMFRPCFQHLGEIERRRISMPRDVTMRLGRLEKPEPWPEELQAEIRRTMPVDRMQEYPDYPPFYASLARFTGVPADRIVVGAGIEEFIRTLMFICPKPGEKVAILWPTCAMFEVYARAFGVDLVRIVADPAVPMTVDDVLAQIPSDARLLILANPGQPVETCFGLNDLRRIAQACQHRDAVFAIDEAYHGFGAPSAIPMLDESATPMIVEFDNVLVLRTFSKAFGAASIRLGFAVGHERVIRPLNAVRQSGEVSMFSMHVATVLMDRFETFVRPSIEAICRARDWLRDAVRGELGLPAWGSVANHVLIDFGSRQRAAWVAAGLAEYGIYVKANLDEPLDRHMLVTCGTPVLMQRFFDRLKVAA